MFSGLVGTSTSGAYIESAAGIREGARTGLAAVTTAALFACVLFFIRSSSRCSRCTTPTRRRWSRVGILMMASARHIDFDDLTELVPAFAHDRDDGVHLQHRATASRPACVLYPLLKVAAGRGREVNGGALGARRALPRLLRASALPH